MTQQEKTTIRDMYQQGMNPEDIAEEFGLDECEVMDYCAEILEEQQ